jgi:hypothetical protein
MKRILFCILFGCLLVGQFTGILHYENDYESGPCKGKVLTTIYELKSKARIESTNYLYYPQDNYLQKKLAEAGDIGVL